MNICFLGVTDMLPTDHLFVEYMAFLVGISEYHCSLVSLTVSGPDFHWRKPMKNLKAFVGEMKT